ncbi:LysR substrate-binding domain-containing protein, partial [Acinetobacter baumannii]
DTTIHLHEQFSKSNLDLVLQAEPVIGPQVSNIALCEFPMRWVGSPKLDIGSETLSLADLAAFPIISFARNSGPHAVIERLFSGSERGERT